jgi:hypothetical protein
MHLRVGYFLDGIIHSTICSYLMVKIIIPAYMDYQCTSVNGSDVRTARYLMQGRYLAEISLDELLQYVHLPSKQASEQLGLGKLLHLNVLMHPADQLHLGGPKPTIIIIRALFVGLTSFKRLCREHGIQVWPYRSIKAAQAEKATSRPQEHTETRMYMILECIMWVSRFKRLF